MMFLGILRKNVVESMNTEISSENFRGKFVIQFLLVNLFLFFKKRFHI